MECYGRSQAESIKTDRPRRGGGQTQNDLAPGCAGPWSSRRCGQATDVTVTQPVEDEGEEFAGGSDLADVRAASFPDTDSGVSERTLTESLHGLDRSPPHQRVALFGDPSSVDLRIRLAMFGGHPGPGAQLFRAGETGHVTDLSNEDRRKD